MPITPEQLPEILQEPAHMRPTINDYYAGRRESLKRYIPIAASLDELPTHLSDRKHSNTKYLPPILYYGFEVADDQYQAVVDALKAIRPLSVLGLDGKVVEIVVLDSNVKRNKFYTKEAVENVEKILGYPPKVYISIERARWCRRVRYDDTSD